MPTNATSYEATYSPELIALAATAFRDYQFKRYGLLLLVCCVINALGFGLALWAGAKLSEMWFAVFVVAIGPIWLAYKHFIGPHTTAAKLRFVLAPAGRVGISSASVVLPGKNATPFELPWSMVKVVQETEGFFLLVVSPFSAYFVPKQSMPQAALSALQARVR